MEQRTQVHQDTGVGAAGMDAEIFINEVVDDSGQVGSSTHVPTNDSVSSPLGELRTFLILAIPSPGRAIEEDERDLIMDHYSSLLKTLTTLPRALSNLIANQATLPIDHYSSFLTFLPHFPSLIANSWLSDLPSPYTFSAFRLILNLKSVKRSVKKWNHDRVGNIFQQIKDIQSQRSRAQNHPSSSTSRSLDRNIIIQLDFLLKAKEEYWGQRSKLTAISEGDRNTKFFHAHARHKAKINNILDIRDSNTTSSQKRKTSGPIVEVTILIFSIHLQRKHEIIPMVILLNPLSMSPTDSIHLKSPTLRPPLARRRSNPPFFKCWIINPLALMDFQRSFTKRIGTLLERMLLWPLSSFLIVVIFLKKLTTHSLL
ncbi:hypothetical protein LIER_35539 [Lithospermum erythrorhizon]|uniref:Uncharacterized protein n=1 Tax=Lithospermum erythrorhizon TaxID=34254 RepID=A0AAV3NWW7_LITER